MGRPRGHGLKKEAVARRLSRHEWDELIDRWIFNERDRFIVRRHILDGVTYARINEELKMRGDFPLSERRLAQIISRCFDAIDKHI